MKYLLIVLCLGLTLTASASERIVVPHTFFNPDWNIARIVSRGAESLRVESKVTVDALKLRIR